jgi:hypothetical protein
MLSELWDKSGSLDTKRSSNTGRKVKVDKKNDLSTGLDLDQRSHKKHIKNPIFAMLDLVEESMHELPQIIKLIEYSKFIIWLIFLFSIILVIDKIIFFQNLPFELNWLEIMFVIIGLSLLIPLASNVLIESLWFFKYLSTRHRIIDNIRFRTDISIPKGKDQLDRLKEYLMNNDPYISESSRSTSSTFKMNQKLEGSGGRRYSFDAVLLGEHRPSRRTSTLEVPLGKFAVFIKKFKDDPSKADLKKFRDEVQEICTKTNTFPLRIIALQSSIGELPEDVYEYVLENPLIIKNCMTHMEIIAEDGSIYSFIPMMGYSTDDSVDGPRSNNKETS